MKYLIFNVTVFLALGYLIVGGDKQDIAAKLNATVEKTKAKVEQVVQQSKPQKVVKPVVQKTLEAKPEMKPKPVQQVVEQKDTKPVAPPELPKAVEVAKVEPKKVPSRAKTTTAEIQKGEVAQVTPVPEAKVDDGAKLQSARDRSRDLRQMVAEMEQMFAEKMTQ